MSRAMIAKWQQEDEEAAAADAIAIAQQRRKFPNELELKVDSTRDFNINSLLTATIYRAEYFRKLLYIYYQILYFH